MITLIAMPQDRTRADAVVDALVAADLTVWGETAVPGAAEWPAAVIRASEARCLIICWSNAALADTGEAAAFRNFANNACAQGKTIGVLFEQVTPPAGFNCTLYSLAGWRAAPGGWRKWLIGDAHLRDVVVAAKSKQANRDPAPPSAPRKLLLRQLAVVFSAVIVPLIAVASFTDLLFGFSDRLNAQPSAQEKAAWNALPPGDCAALRGFIRGFADGAYRDRADALLGAADKITRTEWKPVALDDEIYLPHSAGTRVADAEAEGARRCEMLIQGTGARNLKVSIKQLRQDCQTVGTERQCDWRGTVSCNFEEPKLKIVKVCKK